MSAATLAQIWRHPIKGIGAEALELVELTPDRPLPLDRAWAVREEGGENGEGWQACRNFLRGAKGASLMAVTARVDGKTLHLSHPDLVDIAIPLDVTAEAALIEWVRPIYPDNRRPPVALVRAPSEGMADVPFPSVSVLNLASLRALSQKAGQPLDPRRFRGNLWIDGLAPWEEFDLVGKDIRIGVARLRMVEPITRCRATESNPDTGKSDVDTLRILQEGWGHTDFGTYAMVTAKGRISVGDTVEIL